MEIEEVERLLQPAIERNGQLTWDSVYELILQEKVQLWTGEKSAIVTYIMNYPTGTHLCWLLAGGKLEEIKSKLKPLIEEWAKLKGCTQAEIIGRSGWSKVLKDYKNTKKVKLTKEL